MTANNYSMLNVILQIIWTSHLRKILLERIRGISNKNYTYKISMDHCDTVHQICHIPARISDFTSSLDPRPQWATLTTWLSITSTICCLSSAGLCTFMYFNLKEPGHRKHHQKTFKTQVLWQPTSLHKNTENEAWKAASSDAALYWSSSIIHLTTTPKLFLKSPQLYDRIYQTT